MMAMASSELGIANCFGKLRNKNAIPIARCQASAQAPSMPAPKLTLNRRNLTSVIGVSIGMRMFTASTAAAVEEGYKKGSSGLEYYDVVMGSGTPPTKGTLIKAHYTGMLENGNVFDTSYKRGVPLSFRIGVGEVIKGWDEGILGGQDIPPMLPGGKRKLRIPSSLGYGERGAGCRAGTCAIPPGSVLLFDVELIGKA